MWDLPFVSTSCSQGLEEKESPVLTSFSFPPKCAVAFAMPSFGSFGHPCGYFCQKSCEIHRHFALPRPETTLHRFCQADAIRREERRPLAKAAREVFDRNKLCYSPRLLMRFARMSEILVEFLFIYLFFKVLTRRDLCSLENWFGCLSADMLL